MILIDYKEFLDEIIEVMISPKPNPAKIDPTNPMAGEELRKKNPIPIPIMMPPPMAHVLLSSFFCVMTLILL